MQITDGLTVRQLKELIKDWPEIDSNGAAVKIFVVNDEGYGVPVTSVNLTRVSEDDQSPCVLLE